MLAAETGQPLRVEVVDEAGCADADTFMQAVRARSARIREAEPGEASRLLRVWVSLGAEGGYRGELTLVDDDSGGGWGRSRSIEGKTCREILDSLALFTVLALDPTALGGDSPKAPMQETRVTPPPAKAPAPQREEPRRAPARGADRGASHRAARGMFGIGAGMFAAGVAVPLAAGAVFSEVGLDGASEPGVHFGPSVRISLVATTLAKATVREGSAGLRWIKLGLDGCPVVFRVTSAIAFRPCLSLSEGLLEASGRIAEPKSVEAPFRTFGALARGEWTLGRNWLLELGAAVERPFRRDQFYFEPSTAVYEVPAFVESVTLAGGFRFL